MKSIKAGAKFCGSAFAVLLISMYLAKIELPARRTLTNKFAHSTVVDLARPIIFWQYVDDLYSSPSDTSGWYPVYLREKSAIRNLDVHDRIDMYEILIRNVDFSAESIYDFCAFVQPDAAPLASSLHQYELSNEYLNLPKAQRDKILRWREKFENISQTGNV